MKDFLSKDKDQTSIFVRATGSSTVTLVFEAGAGDSSATWEPLQSVLDKQFSAVAYDRPGTGQSAAISKKCTFARMSRCLDLVVSSARSNGPVFLVAHSLGAVITRLFARDFPQRIAGLVLLDPIPDGIFGGLRKLLTASQFRLWLKLLRSPLTNPEGWTTDDLRRTLQDIHRSKTSLQNLLVISSGNPSVIPSEWSKWWPSDAYRDFCQRSHRDLRKRSRNFNHIICRRMGHYMHRDCPREVASRIAAWIDTI